MSKNKILLGLLFFAACKTKQTHRYYILVVYVCEMNNDYIVEIVPQ